MRRLTLALGLLLLAPLGCPSAPPPADDDDDAHDDEDHEHGTGEIDTHMHAVLQWGDTGQLALGTHAGMYRTEAGSDELVPVFEGPDFMGLVQDAFDPDRYWGSGHWSASGMGNWGFAESTDRGETWTEISMTGQADFHAMAVSADQADFVVGVWNGSFWISGDAGRTWDEQPAPSGISDIEVEEPSGPTLLVASGSSVQRYDVASGQSESVLSEPAAGIDRGAGGWLVGLSGGDVLVCDAAFDCASWDGPGAGAVLHLLGDDDPAHMTVLTAQAEVHHTEDSGATWQLVVTGE